MQNIAENRWSFAAVYTHTHALTPDARCCHQHPALPAADLLPAVQAEVPDLLPAVELALPTSLEAQHPHPAGAAAEAAAAASGAHNKIIPGGASLAASLAANLARCLRS